MDIAEALYCRHGSRETTVRQITQAAGINTSMLNYYFQTKENLFIMMLQRRIRQFSAAKRTVSLKDKNTTGQLLAYTQIYIDLIANNLPFYRLMMTEKLINENKKAVKMIDTFFRSNMGTLRDVIAEGVAGQKVKVRDIETLMMNLSGVLVYAVLKAEEASFPLTSDNKIKLQEHIRLVLVSFISERQCS